MCCAPSRSASHVASLLTATSLLAFFHSSAVSVLTFLHSSPPPHSSRFFFTPPSQSSHFFTPHRRLTPHISSLLAAGFLLTFLSSPSPLSSRLFTPRRRLTPQSQVVQHSQTPHRPPDRCLPAELSAARRIPNSLRQFCRLHMTHALGFPQHGCHVGFAPLSAIGPVTSPRPRFRRLVETVSSRPLQGASPAAPPSRPGRGAPRDWGGGHVHPDGKRC